MFNTDRGSLPTKPVIANPSQAAIELLRWQRENNLTSVEDAEGLVWALRVEISELPDPTSLHKGYCEVVIQVGVDCTMAELIRTRTVDPVRDERLVEFVGAANVPMRLRPIKFAAGTLDDVRQRLAEEIPKIRQDMRAKPLHETKKSLIGRWVDENMIFGLTGEGRF